MTRTAVIGIDGVPFSLLEKLAKKDVMPNFKDLIKEGQFKPMQSSIPANSAVSWSTIITGKNPGEHGIFGFSDLIEGTHTLRFPNYNDLKATPYWQDKRALIINVPMTYPVKPMNGCHISGFVSLDMEKAVYPQKELEFLNNINYQIDVDSEKAHNSFNLFLEDLYNTHVRRMNALRFLWREYDWETLMFVMTGSDRLGHFLWDAYEEKNDEYYSRFLYYFQQVDITIGEITNKLTEDDRLVILSDHGMEREKIGINLNAILQENGYLEWGDNFKARYNNLTDDSEAFALEDGRVYVCSDDPDKTLFELVELFDGMSTIKKVYRREELYHGPYYDKAPDLVLVGEEGIHLRGMPNEEAFEHDHLPGMHNEEAFIYVKGDSNLPDLPTVEDVVTIIENE